MALTNLTLSKLTGHINGKTQTIGYYKERTVAETTRTLLKQSYDSIIIDDVDAVAELIGEYVPDYDHTFIMEATYVNNECIMMECVGWYCGKPEDDLNEMFGDHDLIGYYWN